MKKYLLISISVVIVIMTISLNKHIAKAHDVDNRSTHFNAIPGASLGDSRELFHRVKGDEPHHCDGGVCEGKFTHDLLESEITFNGHTFFAVHKDFGHWRRTLVNQNMLLGAIVNAIYWRIISLGLPYQTPFMNYDPFWDGQDIHHPDVAALYNSVYVPAGYSPLIAPAVRANWSEFWKVNMSDIPGIGGSTNPLHYEECGQLAHHEQRHAPECDNLPSNFKVLVGGDSYRSPFPGRGEGAFNYYDRIPMSPCDDAALVYFREQIKDLNLQLVHMQEGTWTEEIANTQAANDDDRVRAAISYCRAHAEAGKNHVKDINAKVVYAMMVLNKIVAQQ